MAKRELLEDCSVRSAIFSGRFDPPNLGHIMQIHRLLAEYSRVIVVTLDWKKRDAVSASMANKIMSKCFNAVLSEISRNKLTITTNKEHFGYITRSQLMRLMKKNNLDTSKTDYIAGNQEVLEHIRSLKTIRVRSVKRIPISGVCDQYLFESTKVRENIKDGISLNDQYNFC